MVDPSNQRPQDHFSEASQMQRRWNEHGSRTPFFDVDVVRRTVVGNPFLYPQTATRSRRLVKVGEWIFGF